jgi:hypothetical protein
MRLISCCFAVPVAFAVSANISDACTTGVIFDCDLKPSGHLSLCLHYKMVTMDLETGRGTVSASEPIETVQYQPWNGIGSTDSAVVTFELMDENLSGNWPRHNGRSNS